VWKECPPPWDNALSPKNFFLFFRSQNGSFSWILKCKIYFYDVPRFTGTAAAGTMLSLVSGSGGDAYPVASFLAFA